MSDLDSLSVRNQTDNMATFPNDTKNIAVFANQDLGSNDLIWDEATFAWEDAGDATWDSPRFPYTSQTKNSSVMANETKN